MDDEDLAKQRLEFEKTKWQRELKLRAAERQHDLMDSFEKQTNEAAISAGQLALRTCVIINGGAAVAVLAFVGSLTRDKLTDSTVFIILSGVTRPLLWFAAGVAAAAAGLGLAYFANYANGAYSSSHLRTWEHPYTAPTRATWWWGKGRDFAQVLAIVAGVISLAFFCYGMLDVSQAIKVLR